jgi:membrane fusion protein, multidrug efflux system
MEENPLNTANPDKSISDSTNRRSRFGGRWWAWLALVLFLGTIPIFGVQRRLLWQSQTSRAGTPLRAVPIATAIARKGDLGSYITALGTVTPVYTVNVTTRVDGEIIAVNYREGQMVHKGDSLIEIDPRPYQAQLLQYQGQLGRDQALLNESRIDLTRYQAALSRNAIAKQQVDDQQQVVYQYEGTVKLDEGLVESAKVLVAYCHIASPIDGRVGLRLVDPGNIVHAANTTAMLVITQLQPITVIFNVAEDLIPEIQTKLNQGHTLTVDALDRDQKKKLASGTLLTTDNEIDSTTGTVRLRAIFPNKDNSLFPSQFVNASLLFETQRGVTIVPTPAIQRNAQGAFVYLIKPDQTATLRSVTVGVTDGNNTAVQGIEPGEVVASNGFDKLQEGVKVAPLNNQNEAHASAERSP